MSTSALNLQASAWQAREGDEVLPTGQSLRPASMRGLAAAAAAAAAAGGAGGAAGGATGGASNPFEDRQHHHQEQKGGGGLFESGGESAAASPAPSPLSRRSVGGGPSGSGEERSPAERPPSDPSKLLCPCLVVPEGMELVFVVKDVLNEERQQVSFSVLNLCGQPLSHVIINEVGAYCGILLQLRDETPLAWVCTSPVHESRGSGGLVLEISRPSGEVFCRISREDAIPTSCHMLRDTAGQRLYTFHGTFKDKSVTVVNPSGHLVCDTEGCSLGNDGLPYHQVRVAPNVDAGLMLCGLLALQKMEVGCPLWAGRPSSPRTVHPSLPPSSRGVRAAC